EQRLADARVVLDEQMAVGEQRDGRELDRAALAEQHAADVVDQARREVAGDGRGTHAGGDRTPDAEGVCGRAAADADEGTWPSPWSSPPSRSPARRGPTVRRPRRSSWSAAAAPRTAASRSPRSTS